MEQTFEEYLMEQHAKQYVGTDDCMPDDYNNWLAGLDVEDVIEMADKWHVEQASILVDLILIILDRMYDDDPSDLTEKIKSLKPKLPMA